MALTSKEAPLYRVAYAYDSGQRQYKYSILTPAASPEEAVEAVRARMVIDGMPMHRITLTGATLNALT